MYVKLENPSWDGSSEIIFVDWTPPSLVRKWLWKLLAEFYKVGLQYHVTWLLFQCLNHSLMAKCWVTDLFSNQKKFKRCLTPIGKGAHFFKISQPSDLIVGQKLLHGLIRFYLWSAICAQAHLHLLLRWLTWCWLQKSAFWLSVFKGLIKNESK